MSNKASETRGTTYLPASPADETAAGVVPVFVTLYD